MNEDFENKKRGELVRFPIERTVSSGTKIPLNDMADCVQCGRRTNLRVLIPDSEISAACPDCAPELLRYYQDEALDR